MFAIKRKKDQKKGQEHNVVIDMHICKVLCIKRKIYAF